MFVLVKRILWCITGSGSFLRQIFKLLVDLKSKFNFEVGVLFSKAGVEVARLYGVLDKLNLIASGGRYDGIYTNVSSSGITNDGIPISGRISLKRYNLIIVAPATSNTVAKIICGIADTPPTIAVSQALKSNVPIIIFPSDYDVYSTTHLPCYVNEELCNSCFKCIESCPYKAIYEYNGLPRINYNLCRGCETCMKVCSVGAIRCWEEIQYTPSNIDLTNLRKLEGIKGIKVVKSLNELENEILNILNIK